jgi:hypothetical protein
VYKRQVSLIGRFLEHHRIFRFENGGDPRFFIGSADWMSRNLVRRVEVCTPIENELLKAQLQALLDACLTDGVNAWEMLPDGRYHKPCLSCAIPEPRQLTSRLARRSREIGLHSAFIEVRDPWCHVLGVLRIAPASAAFGRASLATLPSGHGGRDCFRAAARAALASLSPCDA